MFLLGMVKREGGRGDRGWCRGEGGGGGGGPILKETRSSRSPIFSKSQCSSAAWQAISAHQITRHSSHTSSPPETSLSLSLSLSAREDASAGLGRRREDRFRPRTPLFILPARRKNKLMSDRSAAQAREAAGKDGGVSGVSEEREQKKGGWCGKTKKKLVLPFSKAKKKMCSRKHRDAQFFYGDDAGGCCFYPSLRPAPSISPPLPPNLNPSSYEFVKFFIESNDFYSPECNVHGDVI